MNGDPWSSDAIDAVMAESSVRPATPLADLAAERDAAVARAEAAEAEAQRLRDALARFVPDCACGKPATTTIGGIPTCGDDR